MSSLPTPHHHPDADHRFFVFDAQDGDHYYFTSAADRDVYAAYLIGNYLDDGWDESVEQVMAGELTHLVQQVDRVERPPADQLDAQGCDAEGRHWQAGWAFYCDYELKALDAPAVSPAGVLPALIGAVLVERDQDGWWDHPGLPDFDEDYAAFSAWLIQQGLELKQWHMDADIGEHHPYDDGAAHCLGWEPECPGPEWFLLGIFDSEEGPCVSWARRVAAEAVQP